MDELKVGQVFPDWESFSNHFASYCKTKFLVYVIHDSRTTVIANKRQHATSKPFSEKLKYSFVRFVCKNFGSYNSRSSGLRPNQRTFKNGCPSTILISADREKECLVVKKIEERHNHDISAERLSSYPEGRKFTKSEENTVSSLLNFDMKVNTIRSYVENKFQKKVLHKDIHNLRARQATRKKQKCEQKLNRVQKYNKMLELCQEICSTCSEHSMEQYECEYMTLKDLLSECKKNGSETTNDDEAKQEIGSKSLSTGKKAAVVATEIENTFILPTGIENSFTLPTILVIQGVPREMEILSQP